MVFFLEKKYINLHFKWSLLPLPFKYVLVQAMLTQSICLHMEAMLVLHKHININLIPFNGILHFQTHLFTSFIPSNVQMISRCLLSKILVSLSQLKTILSVIVLNQNIWG